jgi:precorrin-2 methylase
MRALILSAFTVLLATTFAQTAVAEITNSDVLVVMKINGLNDEMLAKLSAEAGKQRNYTLEYSCVSADIVVLRMNDIVAAERGDAVTVAKRLLAEAGITKDVEFLHVHLEPHGVNKC